jgi:hypothetical protein
MANVIKFPNRFPTLVRRMDFGTFTINNKALEAIIHLSAFLSPFTGWLKEHEGSPDHPNDAVISLEGHGFHYGPYNEESAEDRKKAIVKREIDFHEVNWNLMGPEEYDPENGCGFSIVLSWQPHSFPALKIVAERASDITWKKHWLEEHGPLLVAICDEYGVIITDI